MDLKRHNEIIMLVMNGNRDGCKTDEERWYFDRITEEKKSLAKDGISLDLLHDIE